MKSVWIFLNNKRKKLTFAFAMLSLSGLCYAIAVPTEHTGRHHMCAFSGGFSNILELWFWFSVPLIVLLIYFKIFGEEDTTKS